MGCTVLGAGVDRHTRVSSIGKAKGPWVRWSSPTTRPIISNRFASSSVPQIRPSNVWVRDENEAPGGCWMAQGS